MTNTTQPVALTDISAAMKVYGALTERERSRTSAGNVVDVLRALSTLPAAAQPCEMNSTLSDDDIDRIGFEVFGVRPNRQETEFARAIVDAALSAAQPVAPQGQQPAAFRTQVGARGGKFVYFDPADTVTPEALAASESLYTAPPAPSTPAGWKLVPLEPTEAMLDVLHAKIRIECIPDKREANIKNDREVWRAVLAAAPSAGEQP